MSGGGGSSSGNSAAIARQQEAERQANIKSRQNAIDAVFSNPARNDTYNTLSQDVVDSGVYQLDQEREDADKELMFSLARRGLTGSSVDADSRGRMAQNYLESVRKINDRGEQAKNDLKAKDMQEKSRLYSMAISGGDPASLAQQATQNMSTNAGQVNTEQYLSNVGGLLGNVSLGLNKGLSMPGSGTSQLAKRIGTYFGGSGAGQNGKITSVGEV